MYEITLQPCYTAKQIKVSCIEHDYGVQTRKLTRVVYALAIRGVDPYNKYTAV